TLSHTNRPGTLPDRGVVPPRRLAPRLRAGGGRPIVIRRAIDRPTLDAVLPLEVGQVIEVVLGGFHARGRALVKPGARGDEAADHVEILLDVAGDVQLAAG